MPLWRAPGLPLMLYQHHRCSGPSSATNIRSLLHHRSSPRPPAIPPPPNAKSLFLTYPTAHLSPIACELPHTHVMYPYRRPRRTLLPDAMGPSTVVDPPQRHAVDDGPAPTWSARRPCCPNGAQVRPLIGSHQCQFRHSSAHQRRPSLPVHGAQKCT